MSWFVVFASAVLPIALLFIMLAMEWLQSEVVTTPSPLRARSCEDTDNEGGTKRFMRVGEAGPKGQRYLISAGMLALAMITGQDLNAQTSGPQMTTPLKTDISGVGRQAWNVRTIELAPGVVDTRHSYPGAELVYVLEGAGALEVEGRGAVALTPGIVATLDGKQSHVFKNTSQTQTLKVLVVLLSEKEHQRPLLANGRTPRRLKGLEPIPNGDLLQRKTDERKDSARQELVF